MPSSPLSMPKEEVRDKSCSDLALKSSLSSLKSCRRKDTLVSLKSSMTTDQARSLSSSSEELTNVESSLPDSTSQSTRSRTGATRSYPPDNLAISSLLLPMVLWTIIRLLPSTPVEKFSDFSTD